ncbi:MAG TPA: DUF5719 family protein [Nocardioidaceae bacterium]|nr:DUF5719 family protein [Nocardioidaceae bacterium]
MLAALLGAAVAACCVLAGTAQPTLPTPSASTGRLLQHALRGCVTGPEPASSEGGEGGSRGDVQVMAGSAPVEDLPGTGRVRAGAPGELTARTDLDRGDLLTEDDPPPLWAVQADGGVAAGLFASTRQSGRSGLTTTACPQPRAHWWFTGAGATLDHASVLTVANLDPAPAVVDVRLLGPGGPVETLGTRGVTVPPHGQVTLPMTDLAPQVDELAVEVDATRGRVVAAVADSFSAEAASAPGVDALAAQDRASRVLLIPGLPPRTDAQQLVLANPGDREALAQVSISDPSGTFSPTRIEEVRVPPGSVVTEDLSPVVGRKAASVLVHADAPVTAAVRSVVGEDSSYAGPRRRLSRPAVVPLWPDTQTEVQLTAAATDVTVTAETYRKDGTRVGTEQVPVDAGTTVTWSPGKGRYLLLLPDDGRPLAAAVHRTDDGVSGVGLSGVTLRVIQPLVRPDLA